MDFKSALAFLDGRISYERLNNFDYDKELNLQRFRDFLKRAGIDFNSLKYIHVAGSKGKGTVCKMFADYLSAAGYRVGLFTSPHIHSVCERVKLNGVDIPQERFSEYIEKLSEFVEDETYFEIINAAAFAYFIDEAVEFAVLEVGLGGRLDCTNVVVPILSVITKLEMEHSHILGDTLEKIAYEKLGIVKEGVAVVALESEVVRKLCPRAKLTAADGNALEQNAGLVRLGLEEISELDEGLLKSMLKNFRMKGRFDLREIDGRKVIFDMAHTVESVRGLLRRIDEPFGIVISLMKDKNVSEISSLVQEEAEFVICTNSHSERGIDAYELAKYFESAEVALDPEEALKLGINKNQLLVVTGSTYLLEKTLPRD